MSYSNEFSVGYFPSTFPRDTTEVNVYLEHVLIGQALEPLFTVGDDGQICGAIAKSWEMKSSTALNITIKDNIFFSNGKKVQVEDIIYSLKRHIQNPFSQSYNYLKLINRIDKINEQEIQIKLSSPYAPIFKALTRDQLGILPSEWKFDKYSNEPFIGTGPYRIVKDNGQWHLRENTLYRYKDKIKIKNWKILFSNFDKFDQNEKPADLALMINPQIFEKLMSYFKNLGNTHYIVSPHTYVQYSYWWQHDRFNKFPINQKNLIRAALIEINKKYINEFGGNLSTGIIPEGILGSLNYPMPTKSLNPIKESINLHLLVPKSVEKFFLNEYLNESIKKKFNITFKISSYDLGQKVNSFVCDLVLVAYAGGFFDPEGYLTILPPFFNKSSEDLFGTQAEAIRKLGETEFDNNKRANLYRDFSQMSQGELRYIPGWTPQFKEIRIKGLTRRIHTFKYSYKLIDYDMGTFP
ncbi:MAG: ABC transporter substrate-binding protein [Bacteriovoracaceae bacterium]